MHFSAYSNFRFCPKYPQTFDAVIPDSGFRCAGTGSTAQRAGSGRILVTLRATPLP
jgi:hypothetical protein